MWFWPVERGVITSRIGEGRPYGRHEGIDIAPSGRGDLRVGAIGPGRVVRTGFMPDGYGNYVVVKHPDGTTSLYGHLSKITVREGETVKAGTQLGVMGATGMATGVHLHLTVKDATGRVLDPLRLPWGDRRFAVNPPTPQPRLTRRDAPTLPPPPGLRLAFLRSARGYSTTSARSVGEGEPPSADATWGIGFDPKDILGLDDFLEKLKLLLPDVVGFIFGILLFLLGAQTMASKKAGQIVLVGGQPALAAA